MQEFGKYVEGIGCCKLLQGQSDENHENPVRILKCPERNSKAESPEYDFEALTPLNQLCLSDVTDIYSGTFEYLPNSDLNLLPQLQANRTAHLTGRDNQHGKLLVEQ